MVCIGIDEHHKDFGPLTGAVEDARRWESFFKERLDFDVRLITHRELSSGGGSHGMNLLSLLDDEVSDLGEGSLFGLFLATHGKELRFGDGRRERLFTLPKTSNAVVDDFVNNPNGQRYKTGALFVTLSQLEEVTSRSGLERFFVLDACRTVVDLDLPTGDRRGEREPFAGETIDRALRLRIAGRRPADISPLTTINSCCDGQVAKEFRAERAGAFTLAGIQVLRQRFHQGEPLHIDGAYADQVQAEMVRLAEQRRADLDGQRPSVIGRGVQLWRPSGSARSNADSVVRSIEPLLADFEAQLAAGAIAQPFGACARDTLARLLMLGLPSKQCEGLKQRLLDAQADEDTWRSAQARRSLALVQSYLGRFGSQALFHADALALQTRLLQEESEEAERQAWRQTQQADTASAYTQFIQRWPASLWLLAARSRLQELENSSRASSASGAQPPLAQSAVTRPQTPFPAKAPSALSQPVQRQRAAYEPEMVLIPAGRFTMGSDEGDADEMPTHPVSIRSFELGKFEVTQGQWKAVMGDNPSRFSDCTDNCPVESVSWDDVQQYLQKLNERVGLRGQGADRLPREAEWE